MKLGNRYTRAAQRAQSAIALDTTRRLGVGVGAKFGDLVVEVWNTFLKHLQVGNACRASDHAALVDVLIARGLFTADDYAEAVTLRMEREADDQCARVIREHGLPEGTSFQ